MVQPGDILLERYQIDRLIGAGGMGLIYRARDRDSDEQVAVKILRPLPDLTLKDVERFRREARLLAHVRHPHVLKVLEVGTAGSGVPVLVMELLQGRDLREELKVRGSLGVEEAVGYAIQTCRALGAVHAQGIIHRDVKPQNIFITQMTVARHVKLLDFGISKSDHEGEATLTATQGTLGTPQYMSPEQILGAKEVDARTDLWSLGVILYFLLSGKLPFSGPSVGAVIASIPNREPDPLLELCPDLPLELAEIIHRCLEKSPCYRFQSAEELEEALLPFAPPLGEIHAPAIGIPSTLPPVMVGGDLSPSPVQIPQDRTTDMGETRDLLDGLKAESHSEFSITQTTPEMRFVAEEDDLTVPSSRRLLESKEVEIKKSETKSLLSYLLLGAVITALLIYLLARNLWGDTELKIGSEGSAEMPALDSAPPSSTPQQLEDEGATETRNRRSAEPASVKPDNTSDRDKSSPVDEPSSVPQKASPTTPAAKSPPTSKPNSSAPQPSPQEEEKTTEKAAPPLFL